VAGEWKIAVDELGELVESRNRELVEHHADFDWLLVTRQAMQSLNRLIESTSRLDNVIVFRSIVRVYGYPEDEPRVCDSHERIGKIRPREWRPQEYSANENRSVALNSDCGCGSKPPAEIG
jgi:hypothetical protein